MKEYPIFFTGDMVRAILDGRKTQTRRPVKPQPNECKTKLHGITMVADYCTGNPEHGQAYYAMMNGCWNSTEPFHCPFGQPGDRLWVRETWRVGAWRFFPGKVALDYRANPELLRTPWITLGDPKVENKIFERTISELRAKGIRTSDGEYKWEPGKSPLSWRPSILMPRWASRINLEITGLRVERLQKISESDAIAEGVIDPIHGSRGMRPQTIFRDFWNSKYAAKGLGWGKNPWVWVIEFEREACI